MLAPRPTEALAKGPEQSVESPKIGFEEEFKAERKKNIDLEATNKTLSTKVDTLQARIRSLSKEGEDPAPAPPLAEKPEAAPVAETKPHYVGAWQQFCPDCGVPNPEFHDETECSTCHMHLGSKEGLAKIKACPNCGGVKAKELAKR